MADAKTRQGRARFRIEHQRLDFAHLHHVGWNAIEFRRHQIALANIGLPTLLFHEHNDRPFLSWLARFDFVAFGHSDDAVEREQRGFV